MTYAIDNGKGELASPLDSALEQVLGILDADGQRIPRVSPEQADLVFAASATACLNYLRQGKKVLQVVLPRANALATLEVRTTYSSQFKAVPFDRLLPGIIEFLPDLLKADKSIAVPQSTPQIQLPVGLKRSSLSGKRILLVDDTQKHIDAAVWQFAESNKLKTCRTYREALGLLETEKFDILLSDLLMPAEAFTLGGSAVARFIGESFPMGFCMPYVAAKHGVPLIVVATDTNHHDHPATAMLDFVRNRVLALEESKVLFVDARIIGTGDVSVKDWAESLNTLLNAVA